MGRAAHPGEGAEYEVFFPALLVLKFCFKEEIQDFELDTNVLGFANLDDVLVKIKTKSGETKKFAFQLKHKEKEHQRLTKEQFEGEGGDFSLLKYYEGYKKIEKKEEYHFCLYTNKNVDPKKTQEVTRFRMSHYENCPGKDYFYMNKSNYKGTNSAIYKFEINESVGSTNAENEDLKNFFNKLSVYTNQLNTSEMKQEVVVFFKENFSLVCEEKIDSYLTFFRFWHGKKFADTKVNMDMIKCKLFDLLLTPHIIQVSSSCRDNEDKLSNSLGKAVQDFHVTICGNISEEVIKKKLKNSSSYCFEINENVFVRLLKKYKFIKKDDQIKNLTEEEISDLKNKLFWYFGRNPAIVKFDVTIKKLLYATIRFFGQRIQYVLFGEDIDTKEFANAFQNLLNLKNENFLLFEEMIENVQISLQRRIVKLPVLMESFADVDGVLQSLTLEEILQADVVKIGGEVEDLLNYVPRKVKTVGFKAESLDEITNDSFIIDCGGEANLKKVKNSFSSLKTKTVECELPSFSDISQDTIYLLEKFEGMVENVEKINIHLLKAIDSDNFEWILSRGKKENFKFAKHTIEESKIHDVFTKPVHIMCASLGMGKSTLMRSIMKQTPIDFWTVTITLRKYGDFFQTTPSADEIIKKFLTTGSKRRLEEQLKEAFLHEKKIMWFFDGVDEVPTDTIKNNVIKTVQLLASKGHRIWISSRYKCKKVLEDSFNVLAVEIEELSLDSQKVYIRDRLASKYTTEEIEEIIDKLYQKVKDNERILGIPLQLYTLTKELIDNFNERTLCLTKMCQNFFKAKYQHYQLEDIIFHYVEDEYKSKLKTCQEFAIKSYLDPSIHGCVNPNPDYVDEFVESNEDGEVVFDHKTVAEYLVALWLYKHLHQISESQRSFLQEEKFKNVSYLLELLVEENGNCICE